MGNSKSKSVPLSNSDRCFSTVIKKEEQKEIIEEIISVEIKEKKNNQKKKLQHISERIQNNFPIHDASISKGKILLYLSLNNLSSSSNALQNKNKNESQKKRFIRYNSCSTLYVDWTFDSNGNADLFKW
eukprot:Awhi_evm1s4261